MWGLCYNPPTEKTNSNVAILDIKLGYANIHTCMCVFETEGYYLQMVRVSFFHNETLLYLLTNRKFGV